MSAFVKIAPGVIVNADLITEVENQENYMVIHFGMTELMVGDAALPKKTEKLRKRIWAWFNRHCDQRPTNDFGL